MTTPVKLAEQAVRRVVLKDPRSARNAAVLIDGLSKEHEDVDLSGIVSSTLSAIRAEWAIGSTEKLRPYHEAIAKLMVQEAVDEKKAIPSTPVINGTIKKLMGRGLFVGKIAPIVANAKLDCGLAPGPARQAKTAGDRPAAAGGVPANYRGAILQVYSSIDAQEYEKRRDLVALCLRLEEKIPPKTVRYFKKLGSGVTRMPPLSTPDRVLREIPLISGVTTTDDLKALIKGVRGPQRVRLLGQE